jgi:hypothetical protein
MNSESASSLSHSQNGKRFGKAIVIGASIAGLWTARALIDHFDEVVLRFQGKINFAQESEDTQKASSIRVR